MKNASKKSFVENQKTHKQYKRTYEEKLFDLKQKHTLKIQEMKDKIRFFQSLIKGN